MHAPRRGRLQREDRGADIAAELHVVARATPSRCAISAVVVDLPLVPVIATNGASGAVLRRSRQNSSMSPITSTAALRASPTVQCGAGWVSGTPGASTSAAIRLQSMWRRSATGMPAARAFSTLASVSSNATTSAPPASSALALASPEAPRPNSATFFPANVGDRDHRSFSVESPTSASTIEMIQNRITICGSVQPFCSKW